MRTKEVTSQPGTTLMTGLSSADRLANDVQARKDALDVGRSFLVQAPAGSGKTELLTKRILALLGTVDEPEEILAITFTVGATAEMRNRVMEALAAANPHIDAAEALSEHRLGITALKRSRERGWSLLERPGRLNIQTIDALCLSIAYSSPVLSRLGGRLQPTEAAEPLYELAARRTLEQLGSNVPQLSEALANLLRLRDVNFGDCERLIARMLQARDQWLEEVSIARSLSEEDWVRLRERLEAPLRHENQYVLEKVQRVVRPHLNEVRRLLALLQDACETTPPAEVAAIHGMRSLDEFVSSEHFECLRSLLLTKANQWRKKAGSAPGFKPLTQGGRREHHAEFESILESVRRSEGLLEALIEVAALPNSTYSESEWETVRSIFTVLLHAVGQLSVVFNERGKMDFVEAGLTAAWALSNDEVRHNVSHRTRHLLVDEFQDTSRKQYELLRSIVQEWDPQEHRTCFFVGDPMQSIYLFRNAELALFDEVQRHGFGPAVPGVQFHRLTLSQNFRSIEQVVEPVNAMFEASRRAGNAGADRFNPAISASKITGENAFVLHARFISDTSGDLPSVMSDAASESAAAVMEAVRKMLPGLDKARSEGKPYRIGILVRAKHHAVHIAAALRQASIPFRAIEIETLNDRQEIRDLVSLLRALTQPMDRVAWLSILRAPWCGLSLADLHILAGGDDRSQQARQMHHLLVERSVLLSNDGQVRAQHLHRVLDRSLAVRHSGDFLSSPNGFASWIEETWIALGGSRCIDEAARENVDAFFKLLSSLLPSEKSGATLDARLEKLFAASDPAVQERCSIQLMTIHKAKGLGFDVVLLPELHRNSGEDDRPLIRRLVRPQRAGIQKELLIAPIGTKGHPPSATYRWIGRLLERNQSEEMHRLFYVACTRARTALHLFAEINPRQNEGIPKPKSKALLACGWDYLRPAAELQYMQWIQPKVSARSAERDIQPQHSSLLELAASAEQHLQTRRRLPTEWFTRNPIDGWQLGGKNAILLGSQERGRHPALVARARGVALHALFEQLASLPKEQDRWDLQRNEAHWKAVATALLRNAGLLRREVETETKAVLAMLGATLKDPNARWMLGKQSYEYTEVSWTILAEGQLKTIRCDRVFIAGPEPLKDGQDHLWIVDYKTADADATDSFLLEEQSRYAPQLNRYAEALRQSVEFAEQSLPIILALYYPALQRLQWWPA